MHNKVPSPVTPTSDPLVSKSQMKDSKGKKKEVDHSLQYYSELMKHDAHGKIGGRIRQRRWGKP